MLSKIYRPKKPAVTTPCMISILIASPNTNNIKTINEFKVMFFGKNDRLLLQISPSEERIYRPYTKQLISRRHTTIIDGQCTACDKYRTCNSVTLINCLHHISLQNQIADNFVSVVTKFRFLVQRIASLPLCECVKQ